MPTLVISQDEVQLLLPMDACIPLMESTLAALARGEVAMPLRGVYRLPDSSNFLATMPSAIPAHGVAGVKVITVFPGNRESLYDSHQGAVLLFDATHGTLLAILDATSITTIRTAAVSAVATKLLARPDASVLTILGAGVQARAHIEAIPLVRNIREVRIWSRSTERARAVAAFAEERLGVQTTVAPSAERAVRGGDIVCTVTSATSPILEGAWLADGVHVNAVGVSTPNARELDTAAVVRARLFVDRRESALNEPGDLLEPLKEGAIGPEHIVAEIGAVAAGLAAGRRDDSEITLFKSLGLAIEDLASAEHIYNAAVERAVGTTVELGGHRHA